MSTLMDGRGLAKTIREKLRIRVEKLIAAGTTPTLAILVVGNDERVASYIRAKQQAAEDVGIQVDVIQFDQGVDQSVLEHTIADRISTLNNDPDVHGIILQLPVPKGIDDDLLLNTITPRKDVDGLTETNQAAVEMGRELFPPATPMGIIRLLEHYHVPIAGAPIAIIGQGRLVGKPLAAMLTSRDAVVRTADHATEDLSAVTHGAAVVVSATGQPHLITPGLVDDDVILIDAGLSEVGETLVGDVTPEAAAKARLVTPVPGGVGPMTVVSLLSNVVVAAELSQLNQPSSS